MENLVIHESIYLNSYAFNFPIDSTLIKRQLKESLKVTISFHCIHTVKVIFKFYLSIYIY